MIFWCGVDAPNDNPMRYDYVYDFFTLDGYNLHCTKDFDPKAKAHKDYSTKLMCKMMDKWTMNSTSSFPYLLTLQDA